MARRSRVGGALLVGGVALLAVYAVLAVLLDDLVTTCRRSPYVRSANPDATGSAWMHEDTRRTLAFTAIQAGLALLVLTTMARCPPDRVRQRALLASYAVAFAAYWPGIAAVESAKHAVDDWECHTEHPNAISGHAFYYVWVLATYQYCAHLLDDVRRPAPGADTDDAGGMSTVQLSWWLLLFSLLCLAPQAFFTYFYGYHSIQQMLLGAIVGCFYYGGVLQLWTRQGPGLLRLLE